MLGFWAINSYPLLGKKVGDESWKAPTRNIEVTGNQKMNSEEVDTLILQKLKLRAIQLNVRDSTIGRLKYFVKVPASICKNNEVQISLSLMTILHSVGRR